MAWRLKYKKEDALAVEIFIGFGNDSLLEGSPIVWLLGFVPGFIAAIQFVRRATGKHVFICWRCADERYKARQMRAC